MASGKGFGKTVAPRKAPTAGAVKRTKAAAQYDKMQTDGFPEFTIYVRDCDKPKTWFPIGSLAVQRSSAIAQAIYKNEDELLQGAFRLFPRLAKRKQYLEYGYKLKGKLYQDEPIQVAQRPSDALNPLKSAVGAVKGLFKR